MFSFFNNNVKPFLIATDIHVHLLPGIDDGPKVMEESIEMLQWFKAMGYQRLIATPHVYWEYYPNTKKVILEKLLSLQAAAEHSNIDIVIDAAAEYYLDDHFEKLLTANELMTLDRTDHVLIECSMLEKTMKIRDHLFQMQVQGYRPLLAHPERYLYYTEADYQSLIDNGCQFQINLLSLAGHYGRAVQRRATFLLKKKWCHFVGTDAHHVKHLMIVQEFLRSSKASKLLGGLTLLNDQFSTFSKSSNTTL